MLVLLDHFAVVCVAPSSSRLLIVAAPANIVAEDTDDNWRMGFVPVLPKVRLALYPIYIVPAVPDTHPAAIFVDAEVILYVPLSIYVVIPATVAIAPAIPGESNAPPIFSVTPVPAVNPVERSTVIDSELFLTVISYQPAVIDPVPPCT